MGLTPSLLATLAPSIGEIALLSTRRKFLALLLALANPAVNISRLLFYTDPLQSLENSPTMFPDGLVELDGKKAICVSALQYVIVIGSLANVIQLSWQVGFRTLIAWKWDSSYIPFLWSTLTVVVHIVAAVGWSLSTTCRIVYNKRQANTGVSHKAILWTVFSWTAREEFQLSSQSSSLGLANNRKQQSGAALQESKLSVFLNELAGLGAFLHVRFGTLVFSSLMFIATIDAPVVIARFIVSELVCRLVVTWELATMRSAEQKSAGQRDQNLSPHSATWPWTP